jgi:hypothetical protein
MWSDKFFSFYVLIRSERALVLRADVGEKEGFGLKS